MEIRSRLELANDNAAAFWLAQARLLGWEHRHRPGYTAVRCERDAADVHRVVVTRAYPDPAALEAELVALFRSWETSQLCLEDPYGWLDFSRYGCDAGLGQAVMTREPDAPTVPGRTPAEGLTVSEVTEADGLAVVERTVVEGFPVPARMPWRRDGLLPTRLLELPGFRAWLALLDGRPAGACITYEDEGTPRAGTGGADGLEGWGQPGDTGRLGDGRRLGGGARLGGAGDVRGSVGVYWVATLPEHRSKGVARAVVAKALAAHEGRVATLVATLLGEPVYRRLGFTEQGVTRWWRYPAATMLVPAPAPAPVVETETETASETVSEPPAALSSER